MSIVSGLNLKLPDGRRGHYVRAQICRNGIITVNFFSVPKYGEEKALQLAKAWLNSKKN